MTFSYKINSYPFYPFPGPKNAFWPYFRPNSHFPSKLILIPFYPFLGLKNWGDIASPRFRPKLMQSGFERFKQLAKNLTRIRCLMLDWIQLQINTCFNKQEKCYIPPSPLSLFRLYPFLPPHSYAIYLNVLKTKGKKLISTMIKFFLVQIHICAFILSALYNI